MRVLTLDFWNTLYHHRGSLNYQADVRGIKLLEYCKAQGIPDAQTIATTFFEVLDRFVRDCWDKNVCPMPDAVLHHAITHYENKLTPEAALDLMALIKDIYMTALKPELFAGAVEFVQWAKTRFPCYLISDTYVVRGETLDALLRADNLRDAFQECFYSDVLGVEKPNTAAIERVRTAEQVEVGDIIHVGDHLERDYELARRAGCRFIHLWHDSREQPPRAQLEPQVFIARCYSFSELQQVLASI